MARRFTKLASLLGVSSALAVGGFGLAQASPDHGGNHHHCKKSKHDCCKKSKHDCHHKGSHN